MVLTRSERNRLESAGMDPNSIINAQNIPPAEAGGMTAPLVAPGATAAITPSVQQFLSLAGRNNNAAQNPRSSTTSIVSPDYSSITARGDRQVEIPVQQQPQGASNPNTTDDSWKEHLERQMQQLQQSLQEIARTINQRAPVDNVNPQAPAPPHTPLGNREDHYNGGTAQPNSNEAYTRHFRPVRGPHYAQEFGRISSPVGEMLGSSQAGNKIDMTKWGIKFDGSAKSMSAEEFIFRLNSLRQDYGCTYTDVLRGFHQLLDGQALDWYWGLRKVTPLHTWFDLEKAFLDQYRRYESEFQIQRKIMDRRQMPNEAFEEFYSSVIKLRNQQRTPYPERDLVEIMRGNLKPALSHLLFSLRFTSLNEFCKEAKRAESLLSTQRYQQHRFLAPQRVNEIAFEEAEPSPDMEIEALTSNSKYTCWNCRQAGHSFIDCPSTTRRIFCFKCGKDGVVTPKCPVCQGNLPKSKSLPGETRSTQT